MEEKIILNNIEYNKEDVLKSTELKTELLKQLKKKHYVEKARLRAREYRKNNKELVNEYCKEYKKNRYNNDEVYREKIINYNYTRKRENIIANKTSSDIDILPRGRPPKFKINDDLELIQI